MESWVGRWVSVYGHLSDKWQMHRFTHSVVSGPILSVTWMI